MVFFAIVKSICRNSKLPVFKKEYIFRMRPDLLEDSSNTADHQQGALSAAVFEDMDGRLTLLVPPDKLDLYNEKLKKLNGKDYMQGDLISGSDLMGYFFYLINISSSNKKGLQTEDAIPIRFGFTYLRKDNRIGGMEIHLDQVTKDIYFSVVDYPDNATSYNDGNVSYFFPISIAKKVLDKRVKKSIVLEETMFKELKNILGNDNIFELVKTCIKQKVVSPSLVERGKKLIKKDISNPVINAENSSNENKTLIKFGTNSLQSFKINIALEISLLRLLAKSKDLSDRGYTKLGEDSKTLYNNLKVEIGNFTATKEPKFIDKCIELIEIAEQGGFNKHRGFFTQIWIDILNVLHQFTPVATVGKSTDTMQKIMNIKKSLHDFKVTSEEAVASAIIEHPPQL